MLTNLPMLSMLTAGSGGTKHPSLATLRATLFAKEGLVRNFILALFR